MVPRSGGSRVHNHYRQGHGVTRCSHLLRCRGGHPADQAKRVALRGHFRVPSRQFQAVRSANPCWRAQRMRRHRREHALPDHHGAAAGAQRVPPASGPRCRCERRRLSPKQARRRRGEGGVASACGRQGGGATWVAARSLARKICCNVAINSNFRHAHALCHDEQTPHVWAEGTASSRTAVFTAATTISPTVAPVLECPRHGP